MIGVSAQPLPESADWGLVLLFPSPNCDVEVDPEEYVDDEDGDEGLRHSRDASFSLILQPDVTAEHQANA